MKSAATTKTRRNWIFDWQGSSGHGLTIKELDQCIGRNFHNLFFRRHSGWPRTISSKINMLSLVVGVQAKNRPRKYLHKYRKLISLFSICAGRLRLGTTTAFECGDIRIRVDVLEH